MLLSYFIWIGTAYATDLSSWKNKALLEHGGTRNAITVTLIDKDTKQKSVHTYTYTELVDGLKNSPFVGEDRESLRTKVSYILEGYVSEN